MAFIHTITGLGGLKSLAIAAGRVVADALFPISQAERELFALSPEEALQILPPAPELPKEVLEFDNGSYGGGGDSGEKKPACVWAIFAYKDERVSRMVWNIKYKKSAVATRIGAHALLVKLAVICAGQADSKQAGGKQAGAKPIIIPMPITARRRRERGYNQCELLADEMAAQAVTDAAGSPNFEVRKDILMRTQHKSRQTLKGRAERLEGAKGIFSVKENLAPSGSDSASVFDSASAAHSAEFLKRPVIVIDDVITTGSTILEAMNELKLAGFKDVRGLALAH